MMVSDPNNKTYKMFRTAVQGSILVFTVALVYFAFVYYPKVISNYKNSVPGQQPAVAPVSAQNDRFPVEAKEYRLVYQEASDTYYVYVAGKTLDQFLLNRNSANLTLKNVLSMDTLCNLNLIYASSDNLKIPEEHLTDPNCK